MFKLPRIVVSLTFISLEARTLLSFQCFSLYEQLQFNAQLS